MKKCPYCKKNIPDSAKVCPHCGNRLEKGYRPMKRTNSFPNYIYIVLAFILVFSPVLTTFMFGSLLNEDMAMTNGNGTTPESAITVGPLGEVDASSEIIEYYFGSLKDFNELVKNSGPYVEKIESVEADLKTIASKFGDVDFDQDYDFYVTNQNNIYSNINYVLSMNENESIKIALSYDLSGETNSINVEYNASGFENFEAMKINDQSCRLAKEIVTLFNGEQEFKCFNQTAEKFNALETDFNNQTLTLGNYGLGVNDSLDQTKVAMRVLGTEKNYRFRLTYQTKINLEKLV